MTTLYILVIKTGAKHGVHGWCSVWLHWLRGNIHSLGVLSFVPGNCPENIQRWLRVLKSWNKRKWLQQQGLFLLNLLYLRRDVTADLKKKKWTRSQEAEDVLMLFQGSQGQWQKFWGSVFELKFRETFFFNNEFILEWNWLHDPWTHLSYFQAPVDIAREIPLQGRTVKE